MNYNDQILENKTFNFFKQLMYNLALAICIILVGVLAAVYLFGFKLYKVETGSERPYLMEGDIAVVKEQKEYKVGDLVKFIDEVDVVHRLVGIINNGTKDHYICHGDAVSNLDGSKVTKSDWKDDVQYINDLKEQGLSFSEIVAEMGHHEVQIITLDQIQGIVVSKIGKYGTYVEFIKEHYMLLISLVAGIWCVSSVVQNEIEMKKARRFE